MQECSLNLIKIVKLFKANQINNLPNELMVLYGELTGE